MCASAATGARVEGLFWGRLNSSPSPKHTPGDPWFCLWRGAPPARTTAPSPLNPHLNPHPTSPRRFPSLALRASPRALWRPARGCCLIAPRFAGPGAARGASGSLCPSVFCAFRAVTAVVLAPRGRATRTHAPHGWRPVQPVPPGPDLFVPPRCCRHLHGGRRPLGGSPLGASKAKHASRKCSPLLASSRAPPLAALQSRRAHPRMGPLEPRTHRRRAQARSAAQTPLGSCGSPPGDTPPPP
jgi:hypothetical protein